MDEILRDLNDQQRAAVMHGDGPLLVVAGAGTGKTRVITTRIAHLIASGKAKPTQVLALTFTEKAAREMEQRLYELIGWESYQVPVLTFNAFGAELLGRFASHDGRSIRGGLLKENQKSLLLHQHLQDIELEYYGPQGDWIEFLDGIVQYIGRLQNAGISAGDYTAYVEEMRREPGELHPKEIDEQADLSKFYSLYERVKEESGTYDFYDQILLPLKILQQKPNLAERLGSEYRYVLVDEYQDTNALQDKLLRAFVPPDGNIFVVGDDDQAIYGFRGADISNILLFSQHFSQAKTAVLAQNYRSAQPILDAAYRLIRYNDPDRLEVKLGIDKRLEGFRSDGQIRFDQHQTANEERQAVVGAVAERISAGEDPAKIAVLSTRHAVLAAIAKDLRSKKVPFALSTAVNIFEQPELISLWYLLRWLSLQVDEEAIGHVVMGPFIGWKAADYRRIQDRARDQLVSIEEALELDSAEGAKELMSRLEQWRGWARELRVSQLAFRLVFDTDVAKTWQTQALESPRMIRVFEDLGRWFNQMQDFESIEINTTVSEYCRQYQKPPLVEAMEPVGEASGVQLLTVHAAKGLEFETVYLVGCTRRNWSGTRGGSLHAIPEGLVKAVELPPQHEFRRLMYVATTRARSNLILSAAMKTAGGVTEPPSPLVAEMMGTTDSQKPVKNPAIAPKVESVMSNLRKYYPLAQAEEPSSPLPFESQDGWLELGVTALSAYDFCPFDFYLQHVLKIQQPIGPQLSFGTVLHKMFDVYYKDSLAGHIRSEAEYQTMLENSWSDRGYEDRRDADRDKTLAGRTLARFLNRQGEASDKILGSEVKIGLEIPEVRLRLSGKIDALFEFDGGVEIRDFKTGRTKTDNDKLAAEAKNNFQLRTYALAYEIMGSRPVSRVTLDYVVTGAQGATTLSPVILRNHRQKVASLADRLRQRDFAPNFSSLHTCAAVRYYGSGEADELAEQASAYREGRP